MAKQSLEEKVDELVTKIDVLISENKAMRESLKIFKLNFQQSMMSRGK